MNKDVQLKTVWYWTANFAMVGSAFLSMYMNNGYAFLAVSIPLVLLDRAYLMHTTFYCLRGRLFQNSRFRIRDGNYSHSFNRTPAYL